MSVTYSPAASKVKTAEFIRVLMPVIIIVVLFIVFKKFFSGIIDGIRSPFENLGIADTKEETTKVNNTTKAIDNISASKNNPFNPMFWDAPGAQLLKVAEANAIVQQIWQSVGTFSDSPDETLAAFKKLKYKTQVSWIAYNFEKQHGKDLLQWLQDKLDTTAQKIVLGKIISYVNSLKIGR